MTYTDNDFRLYHHGILGQKWGVRRFQNKDGSLKPAGKKRYSGDRDNDSDSGKKRLTDRQKKTLVIGAVVLGTAVAVYGGVKVKRAMDVIDAESMVSARKRLASALDSESKTIISDAKSGMNLGYWKQSNAYSHTSQPAIDYGNKTINKVAKQALNEVKLDIDAMKTRAKGIDPSYSLKTSRDANLRYDLLKSDQTLKKAAANRDRARLVAENAKRVYETSHKNDLKRIVENAASRAVSKSYQRHLGRR